MLPRMFSLAMFRISEPDDTGIALCRGKHSPEAAAGLVSAVTGRKYRSWRVGAAEFRSSQDTLPDLVDQRREQFVCAADPAGKCRATKIAPFACKNLRLPLKRLVVFELGHQDMCQ